MNRRDQAIADAVGRVGIPFATVRPADVGVAHSTGILGWLIRLGTRSQWNHVFVVVAKGETPETTTVVQAEAHGVELAKLSDVAPGGYWAFLACPTGVNRRKVVAEAKSLLREKYAWLSILTVALHILARLVHLPLRVTVREDSTLICSAVGAISLLAGGWLHPWPDLYDVTPAQLAVALIASGKD